MAAESAEWVLLLLSIASLSLLASAGHSAEGEPRRHTAAHASVHATHAAHSTSLEEHLKNFIRVNAAHTSGHATSLMETSHATAGETSHSAHARVNVFRTRAQIMLPALLRVTQNRIGLADTLEHLFSQSLGLLRFVILVRVPFQGQLAISILDVFLRRCLLNA